MSNSRSVRRLHAAYSDDIGDLRTQRPLPNPDLDHLDPFLFLNHHGPQVYPPRNRGLPFGPHPHRGFETVTFIVEGLLAHRDSAGHDSVIGAGGVQWMTAGRGVEHSELSPREFIEYGGPLEILQLWINLPARLKMTTPRYFGLAGEDIPTVELADGVTLQAIAGQWKGMTGPVESLTDITMATVSIRRGSQVKLEAPQRHTLFFYVVRGEVLATQTSVPAMHLAEFSADGNVVDLEAVSDSLLLFGHGSPYGEPIVAHGPFVMNTREEIVQAIRDYQEGRFA